MIFSLRPLPRPPPPNLTLTRNFLSSLHFLHDASKAHRNNKCSLLLTWSLPCCRCCCLSRPRPRPHRKKGRRCGPGPPSGTAKPCLSSVLSEQGQQGRQGRGEGYGQGLDLRRKGPGDED